MKFFPAQRARLYSLMVAGPAALVGASAVLINVAIDPLWTLPTNSLRSSLRYCVKDERQSKINRLVHGQIRPQSVIIGSSRSAFIDPADFKAESVFNMSVNGMVPIEYAQFIDLFKMAAGQPNTIYVGLDFFGYSSLEGIPFLEANKARWALARDPLYPVSTAMDPEILAARLKLGLIALPTHIPVRPIPTTA